MDGMKVRQSARERSFNLGALNKRTHFEQALPTAVSCRYPFVRSQSRAVLTANWRTFTQHLITSTDTKACQSTFYYAVETSRYCTRVMSDVTVPVRDPTMRGLCSTAHKISPVIMPCFIIFQRRRCVETD